jgi:uncharacterized protein YegL
MQFQTPRLKLGSGTALGAALTLWEQCAAREVVKTTPDKKGDYKPLCFILSDGEPTDAWEATADRFRKKVAGKTANVIAAACGPDADVPTLKRITDTVVLMKDIQHGAFARFFKWVSTSVAVASQKLDQQGGSGLGLPALPDGIQIAETARGTGVVSNRQIILHARCVKTKGFYLLRYAKDRYDPQRESDGSPAMYKGVAAHMVDDFEFEAEAGAQKFKVANQQLVDHPACPYCQNPMWAMCSNGHVLCCPECSESLTLTCPWCGKTEAYIPAQFEVGRGAG